MYYYTHNTGKEGKMRQSLLQDILIYGLPEHLIHFGVVSDFFLLWYIVLVGVLKDFGLISSKYRERKRV
jgi:hypothetical protein